MKTIHQWLEEYGVSHQNSTNKIIHWICVPSIFFSVIALLYSVSLHTILFNVPLTVAHIVLFAVLIYYSLLSIPLGIGMMAFSLICLTLCNVLSMLGFKLWLVALIVFSFGWIGQFIGHKIEGKKPSFLKDLQFLLIGPAWLMHSIFKKLNINL